MNRTLPTDSQARKGFPIFSGCIAYFASALAGVARWSKLNNDKHNPGEPLHHSRGKSTDHRDCIPRHLMDLADLEVAVTRDTSENHVPNPAAVAAILDEADALAWRALALSQELHEKYAGAPLAPGARLPEAPVDVQKIANAARLPLHFILCTGKPDAMPADGEGRRWKVVGVKRGSMRRPTRASPERRVYNRKERALIKAGKRAAAKVAWDKRTRIR